MNFIRDLQNSDYAKVLRHLHCLIERHPLARIVSRDEFYDSAAKLKYEDFAQELFLILWGKNRFAHYLENEMTDGEIKAQISRLEIGNFLMAKIKKNSPESFRLAQRISKIIRTSKSFRRTGAGDERVKHRHFGLADWTGARARQSSAVMEENVRATVPVRRRDNRLFGRAGDTELVINNSDLENLIVSVFKATGAEADIATLRRLVLSRLEVLDARAMPIENFSDDAEQPNADFVCDKSNPEENYLQSESADRAGLLVEGFLRNLFGSIKTKREAQKRLLLKIMLRYFLLPGHLSKIDLATQLSVSDSLVAEHIKKIIGELRKLGLTDVAAASRFESALHRRAIAELSRLENQKIISASKIGEISSASKIESSQRALSHISACPASASS